MNKSPKPPTPPRWPDKLLEWFCPEELLEEVQGDLHERYHLRVQKLGEAKARRLYLDEILIYIRPSILRKNLKPSHTNNFDMFNNFLKTGWRSMVRNKAHALINVSGLALGITCCLMIFLVVRYELSYDVFHSKADRIYRVNSMMLPGNYPTTGAPMPIAQAMKSDFPEVQQATTTFFLDQGLVKVDEQVYKESGIGYVAPEYFEILDAHWLSGNPQKALSEPNSVVLTRSVAQKLFGGTADNIVQTALGKTIVVNVEHTVRVTGILEDLPSNTDLPFKILISFVSLKTHFSQLAFTDWASINSNATHFVLLREGADPARLEKKLSAFDKKYMGAEEAAKHTEVLQPLREMHYDERFSNHNGRIMAKENIAGLILIGSFILLTACINFINLATAQSVKRSKEVGIRKVLGAQRAQLIRQFLAETSLLSLCAMVTALLLTSLLVPGLKNLLSLDFTFTPFTDVTLLGFLCLITALVSILAGLYPAITLSGFQPVTALKNKVVSSTTGFFTLRRSLIVVQFGVAQLLIICTIVVSGQLEYFRSKPLGFTKEAIITVPFPPANKPEAASLLRSQLTQISGIEQVSFANRTPSSQSQNWSSFKVEGNPKEHYSLQMGIDHTYTQTYGLTLAAGQALTATSDSSQILVNETLLKWIEIPDAEKAIGRRLFMGGKTYQIAGVVKDFFTGTLHGGINGLMMRKTPHLNVASIKLASTNMRATIAQIEQIWKKTYPESVFEFDFLDETIAGFYREEVKMFNLFRLFSGIAIFISCLGLYGLVSYMAVQRTKEIGIRKVLGASTAHIVGLFTKEFFILIGIAFVLATPLAWYLMNSWLQNFENQISLGVGSFLVAIVFSLLIAGITVGFRSMKAALSNPVKSLRSE